MIFLLFTAAILALVTYVAYFYLVFVKRYPPGPIPLPITGNLLQIPDADVHIYMDNLAKVYGPTYTLYTPWPTVVLTQYEHIKECLVSRGEHFSTVPLFDMQFELLQPVPDRGILACNGEKWCAQREVTLKILKELGRDDAMQRKIKSSLDSFVKSLNTIEDKSSVDLFYPLQICLGNVINTLFFGYTITKENSNKFCYFLNIITQFFETTAGKEMNVYSQWPWLQKIPYVNRSYKIAKQNMDEYHSFIAFEVDAQIKNFNPSKSSKTFVHSYLKEMSQEDNKLLNIDQLYGIVSDCWLAGMEVTITAIRWAILYVIKYPDVQKKAQQEIDQVIGKNACVTLEDKPNLPYVSALIYEVERFSALGTWINRVCPTEQSICGRKIPANTNYVFNVYSCNQKSESDSFSPQLFEPKRFLKSGERELKKESVKKLTMFGMGRRRCPAESLAKSELFLILTTLLQKFEWLPTENSEADLGYIYGLVMYPTNQPYSIKVR